VADQKNTSKKPTPKPAGKNLNVTKDMADRVKAGAIAGPPRFRGPASEVRALVAGREQVLFDLVCLAGHLGTKLPYRGNMTRVSGHRDPRTRLSAFLLSRSRLLANDDSTWERSSLRLRRVLLRELTTKAQVTGYASLRGLIGNATIALAPNCVVPTDPAFRAAWRLVVTLFTEIYPSRVKRLGRLTWLDRERLAMLQRETAAGLRKGRLGTGRKPGLEGCMLAVDPRLMKRVGSALGREVSPGFEAQYLYYTRPGDHFWPHADNPRFPVNVLVCLDRKLPQGRSSGSAFLAYEPDGSVKRYELTPGSALAVESQGRVHAREPIRRGERITMLTIRLT
jgi:hypothetical protein